MPPMTVMRWLEIFTNSSYRLQRSVTQPGYTSDQVPGQEDALLDPVADTL